ncbi:MAG: excinuclease ABC subunit UvrA, partial [Muribaculaceae bacterium]|nr:excinuclease ABC subunit UvrA [Muribaculaceae bacterium]
IIDFEKIIPDRGLSIHEGAILPLGKYKNTMIFWQIAAICEKYGCTLKTPVSQLPDEALSEILNGTEDRLTLKNETMSTTNYFIAYEGLLKYIEMQAGEEADEKARRWSGQFYSKTVCPECHGDRLCREALHFFIDGKNISQVSHMDIADLLEWTEGIRGKLQGNDGIIAGEILKEIHTRVSFLLDVGLDYMSLDRASATLSGGESQRIRLATQLGSELVNVLYILDEPSIGLHQRDNLRLIDSLRRLVKSDNTVVVVEHDKDMMLGADYIVDIGPKAGKRGGEVVYQGSPSDMLGCATLTSDYLSGRKSIAIPVERRGGNGKFLVVRGAAGHNLQNVDLSIPLGMFVCVTGVSGSGKSSLINGTLQPILSQHFFRSLQEPLPYDSIEGIENIDKVVTVDQSPLGRSPRSNPATYTGLFSAIRQLFVNLPEAKIRGY